MKSKARPEEKGIRGQIVAIARRMAARGLVSSTDGNISCKFGDDKIIITPSGINKARLKNGDLLIVDSKGRPIQGKKARPTSEIYMHLAAHNLRPDIKAVIHAHPPFATALTVRGLSLKDAILPEVVVILGSIPTAPYAAPATRQMAQNIKRLVKRHNAILLSRHGTLTLGKDLEAAYNNLERTEHAARVIFTARLLGKIKKLPEKHLRQLYLLRKRLGIKLP